MLKKGMLNLMCLFYLYRAQVYILFPAINIDMAQEDKDICMLLNVDNISEDLAT